MAAARCTRRATDGTRSWLVRKSMYQPGGAGLGSAVTSICTTLPVWLGIGRSTRR
jgi:hypothetical protein